MKHKVNLSGITIGAAALIVGLAGNVQAIPITHRVYHTSHVASASNQSNQNASLASLTAPIAPQASTTSHLVNARQTRGRQKPAAGNLNLPISSGLTLGSSQGTLPVTVLTAPLLPVVPVNLPPAPVPVVTGAASAASPVGVPDGGATAAMMAGSFGGLALLRKKLKG
ncbi:MAG TPA: VPDSG-CTERM sorting domain-containing protein [Verrucomicrobiae bacterium]|nr:VPDSG-CTERM sorting domain-containing protein [Verrucomicrobiae bacterium]